MVEIVGTEGEKELWNQEFLFFANLLSREKV